MSDYFFAGHKIKVAFVTGHHPYHVPSLHSMFRSIEEVDFYPQALNEFALDEGKVRHLYDAIVFYNFHMQTPGNETEWWEKGTKEALEQLGEIEQGIFMLHHAITAFPGWKLWSDITGIQDRSFTYHPDVVVNTEIADTEHPITIGIKPWSMVDEVYTLKDPDDSRNSLLTVDHPQSMKTIAWTGKYKKARVFCYESGHDQVAFSNDNFRKIVARGIFWVAGRL
jgi:uncharacterized protein